jgi:hypothetical protein
LHVVSRIGRAPHSRCCAWTTGSGGGSRSHCCAWTTGSCGGFRTNAYNAISPSALASAPPSSNHCRHDYLRARCCPDHDRPRCSNGWTISQHEAQDEECPPLLRSPADAVDSSLCSSSSGGTQEDVHDEALARVCARLNALMQLYNASSVSMSSS